MCGSKIYNYVIFGKQFHQWGKNRGGIESAGKYLLLNEF